MGEIDTKPIEPVQVAITLFDEKTEVRKQRPVSSSTNSNSIGDDQELDKEKDTEGLQKELANYKVQLEAKDVAYLQLLHKLEHYKKTVEELSSQLKDTEMEKDLYFGECKEAKFRIQELEVKVKGMSDLSSENGKLREQLFHVLGELKCVQGELLTIETQLASARDDELKALSQAEAMQACVVVEKDRSEELLKRVILMSKQVALQAEMEKQENEVKSDLKEKERENSDYIQEMEDEINQLKLELKNANDEVIRLNCEIETITAEFEKAKTEIKEIAERENGVQIEIALLKADLHIERAKLAAEARTDNVKRHQENEVKLENDKKVTISEEEYEKLIKKAEAKHEIEIMKKELESAKAKVAEFRTRMEQAVTRADAAGRAKLALEEQMRKWREQMQRRKAALAALRQESLSREYASSSSSYSNDTNPVNFEPLGKVLNMKF